MANLKIEELVMEVTRYCNFDCKHCFRGESQNAFMSTETIYNLISNLSEIEKLVLSGGEPFMAVKQLNDVAEAIRRNGVIVNQISIITNGTILNTEVIRALEKLQMVCRNLSIKVSNDKFHQMELERKGLKNRRLVNFDLLSKMFGAELYGTPRREQVLSLIEYVGKAKRLTQDDMDRINEWGEYPTLYALTNANIFNGADLTVKHELPYCDTETMTIKNLTNIDVEGYLSDSYASYEDADSHRDLACNINYVGLLLAVGNNLDRIQEGTKKGLK